MEWRCFDCKSTKNLRAIHNAGYLPNLPGTVVSTAKVQKIWEQFTTEEINRLYGTQLFRLQKYKKFESNSQPFSHNSLPLNVVSTAKVQKIWEQFTTWEQSFLNGMTLFRLQKYKKFESNSQLIMCYSPITTSCFDCKSTKNLRAIHNGTQAIPCSELVVSTAKVQKIWEQFTTGFLSLATVQELFRLQKYKKFESNSQRAMLPLCQPHCCFDCKSTKNLRAIHNKYYEGVGGFYVVSTAKVQKIWEQFTTLTRLLSKLMTLFRLQKYKKFESNSQPCGGKWNLMIGCFDCKSTKNLRAIHNTTNRRKNYVDVVSTAKVQKIWEQFTTSRIWTWKACSLFRLQKYKKFESNSQLMPPLWRMPRCCFDCKSTKNLRAIHNSLYVYSMQKRVVSTAKVQKIWEQFTTGVWGSYW